MICLNKGWLQSSCKSEHWALQDPDIVLIDQASSPILLLLQGAKKKKAARKCTTPAFLRPPYMGWKLQWLWYSFVNLYLTLNDAEVSCVSPDTPWKRHFFTVSFVAGAEKLAELPLKRDLGAKSIQHAIRSGTKLPASFRLAAADAAAFMALTSSLVAKRPLMRGRTSAYAFRLSYRIVFSKVRLFLFSRYLRRTACDNRVKTLPEISTVNNLQPWLLNFPQ